MYDIKNGHLIASQVPKNLSEWNKFVDDAKNAGSTALEFRGDGWNFQGEPHLPYKEIFSVTDLPIIVTIMPDFELPDSGFPFNESIRKGLLEEAIEETCERENQNENYITTELKSRHGFFPNLVEKAKQYDVKVIVADHDFKRTPTSEQITETLEREKRVRADVAKIAYTPERKYDVLKTINPLIDEKQREKLGIPIMALSMGKLGKISRFLNLDFGFGSFGYLDKPTGPGQLSIAEMKEYLEK